MRSVGVIRKNLFLGSDLEQNQSINQIGFARLSVNWIDKESHSKSYYGICVGKVEGCTDNIFVLIKTS